MNHWDQLPPWAGAPAAILLVLGGCIALIGCLGLLRLPHFYQRIHGPAITITLGTGCILVASMILFSALEIRPVVHEVLITLFVLMTAPIVSMLIMRAAVHRELRKPQPEEPGEESAWNAYAPKELPTSDPCLDEQIAKGLGRCAQPEKSGRPHKPAEPDSGGSC